MAILYCEDCGEKVSTDVSVCPHCGKPRDVEARSGWISAYIKNFAVISGTLGILGSVIWFLYQRDAEIATRKSEIVRDAQLAANREETVKLSEKAETRQSKRPVLDLQLQTYESVLNNIAQINTIFTTGRTTGIDKAVQDFITDYEGRMAFVEDRRTEVVMEMANKAILGAQGLIHDIDKNQCQLFYITPILAHCMKLSIANSWDFPTESPVKDDYCNEAYASSFAAACGAPLTTDAKKEFQLIQPSNYQAQKGGVVGAPNEPHPQQ
jgi:hypothetical protein